MPIGHKMGEMKIWIILMLQIQDIRNPPEEVLQLQMLLQVQITVQYGVNVRMLIDC